MGSSPSHGFDLEAYVAGEAGARQPVEEHLTICAECREEVESVREMREFLGALPPEALLDGPPEDADLLLQRTLRQVRAESAGARGRGRILAASAAVVVAAAALGAGVLVGKTTGNDPGSSVAAPAPPTSTVAPGTRVVTGTSASGARLTVGVTPAAGWVRVNASVTGVPAGEKCRLVVIARNGSREIAGNWLVSDKVAADGVNLDGSALIDPADVAAVAVEDTQGRRFVSASL